jgi:hypothetical protein
MIFVIHLIHLILLINIFDVNSEYLYCSLIISIIKITKIIVQTIDNMEPGRHRCLVLKKLYSFLFFVRHGLDNVVTCPNLPPYQLRFRIYC